MAKKETVFQALDRAVRGDWGTNTVASPHINSYNIGGDGNKVIYKTTDKDDYDRKKLELQQDAFLKNRWVKANVDLSVTAYAGLNNVKLMYRDADLMDAFPEIGAALDLVSEESVTPFPDNGQVVHISSKSERVKNILEDLFVNRLNLQLTAPMVIRAMCKYGNQFMLLNIDRKNGVLGWKQMPVFNVERIENGIQNPFGAGASLAVNGVNINKQDLSTQFVWLDDSNSQIPFREWQIAHFRLLTNSLYLPYGVSWLNSARRHWRILSLLEDMMLIYRLERSVERRVYKIYVGAIDDADVPAYMESIANEFKRTPIIDPMTGQVDLRKNILPVHKDTPIPLLDGRTITIEGLAKEYGEGKENYVYSVQDNTLQIVPGKVVWCGKNYTADKLLKITLDDDTYMTLAPEHEIIMRNGSRKRADKVEVGESVMPLYRKSEMMASEPYIAYEKVYNPNSGQYEFTHRLVGSDVAKIADKTVMHHKGERKCHRGESKYDSTPVIFDDYIWQDLRSEIIGRAIHTTNEIVDYINTHCIDYLLKHNSNTVLHSRKSISKTALYRQIMKKYRLPTGQYIQSMKKNHKIKNIEWVEGDDVYCMTVVGLNGEEDRHNFALCSINQDGSWCKNGVFVSNCADSDLFIPTRDPSAPSPVETLPAGQNLTAIDDIKFIQNKVLTALRVPKTFLNFEENVGDGKNLALMDIRFTRVINRIQQAFLMELTRVASIHLFLLGFDDDLTNFTLSMNNPSTQAEQLEIENMQKKIDAVRDAVSDPGNGLPVMSLMRALREIMKWSDKQIKENLEEIRLEKGIAAELEKTTQIIKRTGIFDTVDRIYGEPSAEYAEDQQGGQEGIDGGSGMGGGPSGGGMPAPPMDDGGGSELDNMDSMNGGDNGVINGEEGSVPTQDMPSDNGTMEARKRRKPLITEQSDSIDRIFSKYLDTLDEHNSHLRETRVERAKVYDDDVLLLSEDFDKMIASLGKFVDDEGNNDNK